MKNTFNILMAVTMLVLLFMITACSTQSLETPSSSLDTSPTASKTAPSGTTTAATDYSGLGLTEQEIEALKERGTANVDSAEIASKIAGFKVAEPSYVPDGYTGEKFNVTLSGAGMPEALKPKFNDTTVECIYSYHGETSTLIDLIQKVHRFSVGGSEPTEICGRPAERSFSPADPQSHFPGDRLTFTWEIDGNYFALTGVLGDTLDEAALIRMACSISID
jgi:hypothetical protein